MKKKVLVFLALCFMLPLSVMLTACGGGGGDDNSHTHSWGEWEIVVDPTCTTKGEKERACETCQHEETEEIDALGHSYSEGVCTVCGDLDPALENALIEGRELKNLTITSSGTLKWAGLRVASKYVLSIKDSSGNAHNFDITKQEHSIDLTNLADFTLAFGKNSATLTAYESEEVTLGGSTYTQDVPISTAKDSFDIVSTNTGYSINRKTYSDEYVTIKNFDSTVYHDETHGDYLLYEQAGKKGFKYSATYTTFGLLSNITTTDDEYSIRIYKSQEDKDSGDVFEENEKIKMLGGEHEWIIIDVCQGYGNTIKSYNVLLYCTRPLEIYLYKSDRSKPDANGKVTETKTSADIEMTVTENNILDINSIYSCIPEGMLIRDENYNIFEKNTDYNTKDMNIVGTIDYVLTPGKVKLYFAEEAEVRELAEEIEDASKLFDISYGNNSWNITYNETANNETLIIPALIIGYETNCSFKTDSGVRNIIFESGTTSIASHLLENCDHLESVKIPATVTSVGGWLFSGNLNKNTFRIYLEGSVTDGYATWWNKIGNTTNLYSYYANQADCCSTVIKNNVSIKIDSSNGTGIVVDTTGSEVTIPESINYGAKVYCVTKIQNLGSNLTTLSIPKTVTTINTSAFSSNLAEVEIADENEKFMSVDDVIYNKGDLTIFYIVKGIRELKLLPSITEISGEHFENLSSLETINMHAGITNIDLTLFDNIGIKQYVVDKDNLNYSSVDGNLYSKDGKEFIRVAIGKESITSVPSSVTAIRKGSFKGYSLSKVELPFVGGSTTENQYIGYIFGLNSYYSDHESSMPSTLKEVVITGGTKIADWAFYHCSYLTAITIPRTLTTIGTYAFNGCTSLTAIEIPKSVTRIGTYAFNDCTSLTSVSTPVFGSGASSFSMAFNTSSLKTVVIYEGASTLKSRWFAYCGSIETIVIPSSVTSIEGAFDYSAPANVQIASGNTTYKVKNNCILSYDETQLVCVFSNSDIPSSVTTIASYAFNNYNSLTTFEIPKTITTIDSYAFNGCKNLASITFEEGCSLTTIGSNAFTSCTSLAVITIPKTVTAIGDYVFDGCTNLASITFEADSTLATIGLNAFRGCTSLTAITIPKTVTTIGDYVFDGCTKLASIMFEENCALTTIGLSAFRDCTSLTTITIPKTVTTIGYYVFYNCTNLATVTFEEDCAITKIGIDTFYNCTSLTTIELPSSVTSLGNSVFYKCNNLEKIFYGGTASDLNEISGVDNINSSLVYYYSETKPTETGNYWHYETDGKTPAIWEE